MIKNIVLHNNVTENNSFHDNILSLKDNRINVIAITQSNKKIRNYISLYSPKDILT